MSEKQRKEKDNMGDNRNNGVVYVVRCCGNIKMRTGKYPLNP